MTPNQRIVARRLREWGGISPSHCEFLRMAVITPKMLDTLALMERRGWIRMVGDHLDITEAGIRAHNSDIEAYARYRPWVSGLSAKATRHSPKPSETS